MRPRPTGVTPLIFFAIVSGLIHLWASERLIVAWGVLGLLGGVYVILSLLFFALTFGCLEGFRWAWTVGIALAIMSILNNLAGLLLVPGNRVQLLAGIIIQLLIIRYLARPHVKAYFGKRGGPSGVALPSGSVPA